MIHKIRRFRGKNGLVAIKLDLEKAYDRIRWDFLEETLVHFRFPRIWVDLIMFCVLSSRLSVLWNHEKTDFFSPSRGLRQGNPISPYLFVLCMEGLGQLIQQAVENNTWKPIKLGKDGPRISHLFFIDDLFLFGRANEDQANVFKSILDRFCLVSGAKVSYEKSKFFISPKACSNASRRFGQIVNLGATLDLKKYLGVPLIHGRITKATYSELVDKVHLRLNGWKMRHLSMAGRATLVRFLWAGDDEKCSPHLVAWNDNWLWKPLVQYPDVSFFIADNSTKVSEFITANGKWDLERVFAQLLMDVANKVTSYPLPRVSTLPDSYIWGLSTNETWLAENLEKSKHSEEYIAGFAATLWKLWTYRRVKSFDQNGVVSDELGMWAPKDQFMVTWKAPSDGIIKLNTDGASQGSPGLAGAGGIFRNASGEWILGFSALVGICTSMAVELQAVRMGLMIAWDKGFRAIECEVDAQLALPLIDSGCIDIRNLKNRSWSLTFLHTYREGNFSADILSKMGCSLDEELVIFEHPPT
ncbi:uncharacterized protein LOC120124546 [Hibiscus syriacus]|uniref:uncharacterized protein LOC120124546 n=1 Tax=Hibiscus syriacus TaxID=106335 RepID=UPI001921D093|nr:uncharacterized protein LOC120124546 [Hibiscus syriacus]